MMTVINDSSYESASRRLICKGRWDLAGLPYLKSLFKTTDWPHDGEVTVDGSGIQQMDTAGAWLLTELSEQLQARGCSLVWQHFSKEHEHLLTLVKSAAQKDIALPVRPQPSPLEKIGKSVADQWEHFRVYLEFVGILSLEAFHIMRHPRRWRWQSLFAVIYSSGYQALPIIALLSLLIGVVITYQMGLQLKNYGANIYIVDLLGLSILREFGPLITAIMVAGRTGSAFTAQLGMMKLNQEIDALNTMGVTPGELLLLPRILGLFIALPLVTIWADIFGILGGMVTSSNMLSITWYDFLHRFPRVIPLRALLIGIGKAPVFALIISSIGCFEGMQVKMTADSVGRNTTKSVVLAIFFIIVADAVFSVIFSELKL